MSVIVEFFEGEALREDGEIYRQPLPKDVFLRDALMNHTNTAFLQVQPWLPPVDKPIRIILAENPSQRRDCVVGARITDQTEISIGFNLNNPEMMQRLQNTTELPYLVAHEIHHVERFKHHGIKTIGDWVVSEGLAVAFSREAVTSLPSTSAWDVIPDDRARMLLPVFRDVADRPITDADNPDKTLETIRPYVYGLGAYIVGEYQKQQGQPSAMTLASAPTQQILSATLAI
jgi:hypothetical protein